MAATADAIRSRFCSGVSVMDSPLLTLDLAAFELVAGDRRALDRLAWVVESAGATWTWPRPDHRDMTAEFCSFVRTLLVRDVAGGLSVCNLWPEEWRGQALEVHDAPTGAGLLSFAVRWHGRRPALLWELRPRHDRPTMLRAPGLDPRWASVERAGDVLLDPTPRDP
jgi:hypothetical protein